MRLWTAALLLALLAAGCRSSRQTVAPTPPAPEAPPVVADTVPALPQRQYTVLQFTGVVEGMTVDGQLRIAEDSGLHNIVLSGGSFQNMYILERLVPMLEAYGFSVYTHSRVSCNDEGLSLGQLMIGERYVSGGAFKDK